jgi:hypothetical protein
LSDKPPTKTKGPPPRRHGSRDIVVTPPTNLQKSNSGLQDLNFKVDPGFHTVFKVVATIKGMSMKELLEASFKAWVDKFGDDQIRAITAALPPR